MGRNPYGSIFLYRVCPAKLNHTCRCKSGLARDLGNCLQSRNVPFGTSGDFSPYALPFNILVNISFAKVRSSFHPGFPVYQNSVTYFLTPSSHAFVTALSKSTCPVPNGISRNFPGTVSFKCIATICPFPSSRSSSTSFSYVFAAVVIFPISG